MLYLDAESLSSNPLLLILFSHLSFTTLWPLLLRIEMILKFSGIDYRLPLGSLTQRSWASFQEEGF